MFCFFRLRIMVNVLMRVYAFYCRFFSVFGNFVSFIWHTFLKIYIFLTSTDEHNKIIWFYPKNALNRLFSLLCLNLRITVEMIKNINVLFAIHLLVVPPPFIFVEKKIEIIKTFFLLFCPQLCVVQHTHKKTPENILYNCSALII